MAAKLVIFNTAVTIWTADVLTRSKKKVPWYPGGTSDSGGPGSWPSSSGADALGRRTLPRRFNTWNPGATVAADYRISGFAPELDHTRDSVPTRHAPA